MEPKWLYRLESMNPKNGLWYDAAGNYVWGLAVVQEVPLHLQYYTNASSLPCYYRRSTNRDHLSYISHHIPLGGLQFYSRVQDFEFARYLATEYVEYPLETTFIKDTSLAREVIDIEELFKENVE